MSERIYVAVAPSGLVKLGFSGDPERRVTALCSPLGERAELVLHFAGSMSLEQTIHRHLQEVHGTRCEWYPSNVRDLFAAIQEVVARRAKDDLQRAFNERMASVKKDLIAELTAVAEEAVTEGVFYLSEEKAVESFSALARSLVRLINEGIAEGGRRAGEIVRTAVFVDPGLAETLLSEAAA